MFLPRLSIKHQLLLIVMIVAFPAVFVIVQSGIEQKKNAVHNAKLETQKFAEAIVNEQRNLVASTRQLFIALSQLPEVKEHKQAEVQAILAEILRLSPQYSNIFIADASGSVWASGVPLSEPVAVADRRYFKNALASGRLSSGEYHVARTSRKPTLNLGYPVKGAAGQVTDVICAGFSLDYYRHTFDAYQLPQGASFALLDHQGIILTRAIEPEKFVGKPSNPEIFRYMLTGPDEETSIGTSSVVGDNRIQTYRKMRLEGESTPYMYVRAGIPTDIVMSEANSGLVRNLLIYSASLLAAFVLAWLVGKNMIIDRILLLQRSSHRLAEGDLTVRVAHEVGGGELGSLARAFDDMADKLALREQALRESESNYRNIFNTTHDALFVNDADGRFCEANRSAEIMFGYSREELLQMSVGDLVAGVPPYSLPEALKLIEKTLQVGAQNFEWLCRRKNGELFWTELAITPTSDVGARRILAVIRDITARKEVEHMKEAMLSSISHEMRTPLTAMLGFLEFVIDNPVDDAQLKDYHVIMHKEAERLNEMITNFLDMQSLKARLHEFAFKPHDVLDLVEGAIAVFSSPSAKHAIAIELPAELPPILGDEELLHQALSNLLSNAVKYSAEGSRIIVGAHLEAEMVTLWVKDEGVGIPPAALTKIFDMFYRVEGSGRRQVAGTGLGLALVKEIAETHRGSVRAESTLGQGSTFYLSLPSVTAGDRNTR